MLLVNDAYNEFVAILQYYQNIAMPKNWEKIKQQKKNK
jgi:hypothetical protein